eukprot:3295325-Pleurochrysis_carterae.AAC.12
MAVKGCSKFFTYTTELAIFFQDHIPYISPDMDAHDIWMFTSHLLTRPWRWRRATSRVAEWTDE